MKKIGIIFAMNEELVSFKDNVDIKTIHEYLELKFYETVINNITCILVESGVGKVNAARTTQILIDKFDVTHILNVGVAGGISSDLNVCDVVVAESLVQHDFDITAFDHEKGYIPNVGVFIKADEDLLNITKKVNEKVKYGVIASGDIFCTEAKMGEKINNKFNALCVEMEGASIAQVCLLDKIPFLVIRSISDVPNNDNVITYDEFLSISTKKVSDYLIKLINNM